MVCSRVCSFAIFAPSVLVRSKLLLLGTELLKLLLRGGKLLLLGGKLLYPPARGRDPAPSRQAASPIQEVFQAHWALMRFV
jgi:hypothetical protein